MHPTIDEQLAGAQRLLTDVRDDPALSPAAQERLANVARLLTQVERSCSGARGFLVADNAELRGLLGQPGAAGDGPADETTDIGELNARNVGLRRRLSDEIAGLPDGDQARERRRAVGSYLRRRVDADPI